MKQKMVFMIIKVYDYSKWIFRKSYIGLFENDDDVLRIIANVDDKGYYNMYIADLGTKTNEIIINDNDSIMFKFDENKKFKEVLIGTYFLKKGDNTIDLKKVEDGCM